MKGSVLTMLENHPALDAERTGSKELLNRFCLPPEFDYSSYRSVLLVGGRGCGKTMLLRWLRHKLSGLAVYGDLRKIARPVSMDTGLGGLAWKGISPNNELAAAAKTITCLALWFAKECGKRTIPIPKKTLRMTLPRVLRNSSMSLNDLYEEFCYTGLEYFTRGPTIEALLDLFHEVHIERPDDGLVLLLDRAEDVPYPSLTVLLSLLDQSHKFRTILACRPGLINMKSASSDLSIAGDHYDVIHLGSAPYSTGWQQFQNEALTSWLPKTMAIIPSEYRFLIANLTRDCFRSALKIAHSSTNKDDQFCEKSLVNATKNIQDNLLGAFQGHVRDYNSDVRRLLREIRRDLNDKFKLPLLIRNEEARQPLLFQYPLPFGELTRNEQFVYLALRSGFFTTKHGIQWHPNETYDEFELNPIMIWQKGDTW